jgi:hypothetical protein
VERAVGADLEGAQMRQGSYHRVLDMIAEVSLYTSAMLEWAHDTPTGFRTT